jgi:signal transduction histidine kinase
MFDPFFTTKGIVGTGLGLWISREIVDRHRGRLLVRTRRGKGTVFELFLPFEVEAGKAAAGARAEAEEKQITA